MAATVFAIFTDNAFYLPGEIRARTRSSAVRMDILAEVRESQGDAGTRL